MDIKSKLDLYLKEYLEEESQPFFGSVFAKRAALKENVCFDYACEARCTSSIDSYIDQNKDDNLFQTLLYRFIDRTNKKDSDIYNKVNMDRRLFSKLRNPEYHPSKETVILLGLALELNEDEIEDFLKSASYSLPKNNKYDLIIRFCFINKIYDVFEVNALLDDYGLKTLYN